MTNLTAKVERIPVHSHVCCADGLIGYSDFLIISPLTKKITHFAVQVTKYPYHEYVVPVGLVREVASDSIQLDCNKDMLLRMPVYNHNEVVDTNVTDAYNPEYGTGSYRYWAI